MDQIEKARTAKNEWKYINEWRSKCSSGGWSYSFRHKAGKKFEVRENKGSVKICELDSSNRDVDRESDMDELSDSLRPIEMLSMHSCSTALSFVFWHPYPFSFSSFCQTSFKKNRLQENRLSALSALQIASFRRFARKFHQEVFPALIGSVIWEGVCGRSLLGKQDIFLSAVFLNKFFAWSKHIKEL